MSHVACSWGTDVELGLGRRDRHILHVACRMLHVRGAPMWSSGSADEIGTSCTLHVACCMFVGHRCGARARPTRSAHPARCMSHVACSWGTDVELGLGRRDRHILHVACRMLH